jgi:hypothetical protein
MSHRFINLPRALAIAVGMVAMTAPAFCQSLNSSVASVALSATLNESLTVSATPGSVSFNLVAGSTALGSGAVTTTTSWVLNGSRTKVTLTGYFSSATAALTSGGTTPVNIPSSAVLAKVDTASAFSPFTATGPLGTAGAGLSVFSTTITNANRTATQTDTMNLEIDLSGSGQAQLPAGTYTGTLNLAAQAL